MLQKISKSMAHFFVVQNVSKLEYEAVYAYGAEILLSTVINGCIVAAIAILTKTVFPSLIFLLVFILMRRTAGGYHADTHIGCMAILVLVHLAFVILIKNISTNIMVTYSIGSIIFTSLSVYFFAPVEHPNKPLKAIERNILRKKAVIYVTIITAIDIICILINHVEISVYISSGFYVSSTAMLSEKIAHRGVNQIEK